MLDLFVIAQIDFSDTIIRLEHPSEYQNLTGYFRFVQALTLTKKTTFHGKENFNPFPNKPLFLRVRTISLLKTLGEKEKLLVTSNFSFSTSVFYPFGRTFFHLCQRYNYRLQTLSGWESLILSFGKGLIISPPPPP